MVRRLLGMLPAIIVVAVVLNFLLSMSIALIMRLLGSE